MIFFKSKIQIPYVHIKGFGVPTRGPGIWKLNNHLLTFEEYVHDLKEKIPQFILEAERDIQNIGDQWAYVKHKMGEYSRNYGAKIKSAKNLLKLNLEKVLSSKDDEICHCTRCFIGNLCLCP